MVARGEGVAPVVAVALHRRVLRAAHGELRVAAGGHEVLGGAPDDAVAVGRDALGVVGRRIAARPAVGAHHLEGGLEVRARRAEVGKYPPGLEKKKTKSNESVYCWTCHLYTF